MKLTHVVTTALKAVGDTIREDREDGQTDPKANTYLKSVHNEFNKLSKNELIELVLHLSPTDPDEFCQDIQYVLRDRFFHRNPEMWGEI